MNYWPKKRASETLDYKLDWSARLDGDTIVTAVWTVPDGLTMTNQSKTTNSTTIWLEGGTAGGRYSLICKVTTIQGRTMEESVGLEVN